MVPVSECEALNNWVLCTCLCFYSQTSAEQPVATAICHNWTGVINVEVPCWVLKLEAYSSLSITATCFGVASDHKQRSSKGDTDSVQWYKTECSLPSVSLVSLESILCHSQLNTSRKKTQGLIHAASSWSLMLFLGCQGKNVYWILLQSNILQGIINPWNRNTCTWSLLKVLL